jgi:hypothetical protein
MRPRRKQSEATSQGETNMMRRRAEKRAREHCEAGGRIGVARLGRTRRGPSWLFVSAIKSVKTDCLATTKSPLTVANYQASVPKMNNIAMSLEFSFTKRLR